MLLADTPVCVQVRVTTPWLHPVVRPTLLAVCPTFAGPVPPMLNESTTSSEPLLGPVVFAMLPRLKPTPLAP